MVKKLDILRLFAEERQNKELDIPPILPQRLLQIPSIPTYHLYQLYRLFSHLRCRNRIIFRLHKFARCSVSIINLACYSSNFVALIGRHFLIWLLN